MATPSQKRHLTLLLLLPLSLLTFLIFPLSPSPPLPPPTTTTTTHFLPSPPHQPPFTFTIKLLAFNRLSSLSRSLTSLSSALYSSDPIHLHIFLDHLGPTPTPGPGPNLEVSKKMLEFVDGFEWKHGLKVVHYRTLNVGLQAQWLEAWWPINDHDFVFVVEDDLEVSPFYYQVLKGLILNYYYNDSNFSPYVFGASLQRPRFVPGKHGNKINLDDETRFFLYQVVGTWGQLLFPRPWKEFRLWYDDHKAKGIKPILDGMVTTGWYKKMGERIWTPWFFKFIHSRGYFNIYTNLLHERALSVSHRDAGVNYGKTAGPDSQLLKDNSGDINLLEMPPLSKLQWYDFCFKRVFPGRVAKKLDEVGPILHSMTKEKPVLLVSLLKSSDAIVRNLICHFERLNIQNYIFIGPNSKSDLLHDLSRRGHPVIIADNVFDSIRRIKKFNLESIKEIAVVSYAIKKCLESGFDSWVIPSNMLPLSSNPLLDSADTVYTSYVGKGSRFFFIKSSSSSRQLWEDRFLQKFTDALDSLVVRDPSLKENGNFVDFVEKFVEREHYDLKLKDINDASFSLKLEDVNGNQSLPTSTRMISWSSETDIDLVHKHLEELGLWNIDNENSCKAVICHQS